MIGTEAVTGSAASARHFPAAHPGSMRSSSTSAGFRSWQSADSVAAVTDARASAQKILDHRAHELLVLLLVLHHEDLAAGQDRLDRRHRVAGLRSCVAGSAATASVKLTGCPVFASLSARTPPRAAPQTRTMAGRARRHGRRRMAPRPDKRVPDPGELVLGIRRPWSSTATHTWSGTVPFTRNDAAGGAELHRVADEVTRSAAAAPGRRSRDGGRPQLADDP